MEKVPLHKELKSDVHFDDKDNYANDVMMLNFLALMKTWQEVTVRQVLKYFLCVDKLLNLSRNQICLFIF